MFRRLAILMGLTVASLFVSAGAASAYTPSTDQGQVSRSTVSAGGEVTFSNAEGQFQPGSTVTIGSTVTAQFIGGAGGAAVMLPPRAAVVGTTTADANGDFSVQLRLSEPGLTTLTAKGVARDGSPLTVTSQVRVLAAAAGVGSSNLPRTGSDIGIQVWIGAGLLALGAGLVVMTVARRREGAVTA